MLYAVGDRVQVGVSLAEEGAAAGWVGYVTEVIGGPQGEGSYRVERPYGESAEIPDAIVPEQEIVDGPLPRPVYQVGQHVAVAGEGAEITAIDGELHTVLIEESNAINRDIFYPRIHILPLWRLALEN